MALWKLIILALFVAGMSGCALTGRAIPNKDQCLMQVYNATGDDLKTVEMYWMEGERERSVGASRGMPPRVVSMPMGVSALPETASLKWSDSTGREHTKILPIASQIPNVAKFRGGVVVRIFKGDEVKISWLSFAEYEWGKNPELD